MGVSTLGGLADYRAICRSYRYRSNPSLQAATEGYTFICLPDDHETANDCYWGYASVSYNPLARTRLMP